jgi:hypothetical protein
VQNSLLQLAPSQAEYDWLLKSKEHHNYLYPEVVSSPIGQKELCYLREDCDFGLKFLDENSEHLFICDYVITS